MVRKLCGRSAKRVSGRSAINYDGDARGSAHAPSSFAAQLGLSQQQPHGLYGNHQQRDGDNGHSDRAKDHKQKLEASSYPHRIETTPQSDGNAIKIEPFSELISLACPKNSCCLTSVSSITGARGLRAPGFSWCSKINRKNRVAESSRINMNEALEVRYWTGALGCSEVELATAVARVGNSIDAHGTFRH